MYVCVVAGTCLLSRYLLVETMVSSGNSLSFRRKDRHTDTQTAKWYL
jgi:hypothetical protein